MDNSLKFCQKSSKPYAGHQTSVLVKNEKQKGHSLTTSGPTKKGRLRFTLRLSGQSYSQTFVTNLKLPNSASRRNSAWSFALFWNKLSSVSSGGNSITGNQSSISLSLSLQRYHNNLHPIPTMTLLQDQEIECKKPMNRLHPHLTWRGSPRSSGWAKKTSVSPASTDPHAHCTPWYIPEQLRVWQLYSSRPPDTLQPKQQKQRGFSGGDWWFTHPGTAAGTSAANCSRENLFSSLNATTATVPRHAEVKRTCYRHREKCAGFGAVNEGRDADQTDAME